MKLPCAVFSSPLPCPQVQTLPQHPVLNHAEQGVGNSEVLPVWTLTSYANPAEMQVFGINYRLETGRDDGEVTALTWTSARACYYIRVGVYSGNKVSTFGHLEVFQLCYWPFGGLFEDVASTVQIFFKLVWKLPSLTRVQRRWCPDQCQQQSAVADVICRPLRRDIIVWLGADNRRAIQRKGVAVQLSFGPPFVLADLTNSTIISASWLWGMVNHRVLQATCVYNRATHQNVPSPRATEPRHKFPSISQTDSSHVVFVSPRFYN
jgi:hypothetical protein